MRKNILDKSIELLGISEGDIIEVPSEIGKDIYQYKNGVFTYLNGDEPFTLGEDEVFELINGREFNVIAYGRNPSINEMKLEILSSSLDTIEDNVSVILEKQKQAEVREQERKKREKVDGIIGLCIWAFIILIAIIVSL